METVTQVLQKVYQQLEQHSLFYGHGSDNPWDEAVYLVMSAMNLPIEGDPKYLNDLVSEEIKEKIQYWLDLRITHKLPLPYITGTAYFCGLPFHVDKRVLIPRSPIGELIQNKFRPWLKHDPKNVLDLCTGSGCIAIACGYVFPEANVVATDISEEVLEVAKINRESHNQFSNLKLIQSDLFKNLDSKKDRFDLIVSNPPYVDKEDMMDLPDEFKVEPKLALEAGFDGLALVHIILKQAAKFLNDGGIIVVEVGNSAGALQQHYPKVDFTWLEFEKGGLGVFTLSKLQLIEHFSS